MDPEMVAAAVTLGQEEDDVFEGVFEHEALEENKADCTEPAAKERPHRLGVVDRE